MLSAVDPRVLELMDELEDRIAAEKYVAAAYLVVFGVFFLYFVIHVARIARLSRELEDLTRRLANRDAKPS